MRRRALVLAIALAAGPALARAAGPLVVNGAGVPLRWTASPVLYNPDRGRLGVLDNAGAASFVASRFAAWQAVPSATISFASATTMPVDVKVSNYRNFLGTCDGLSPIIFDDDGSITDDLLGVGARNAVLGFASPECGDGASGTITEAIAVLNGRFIDGVDNANNLEVSVTDFGAVFLHEFGHFFNLDHSQVNLAEALDGDPGNDDAVPTMFPFLVNAAEAASLALDDVASVSALYPTPDFAATTGTIRGRILRADGTPFQGAYVIARGVGDPRHVAVGAASGTRFVPGAAGGPPPESLRGAYEIAGLPPGTYTVEVGAIDGRFTGGSSVGPLDPPAILPGVPEFWSGPNEGPLDPPDDPDGAEPVVLASGALADGIDITLNEPVAANDACTSAIVVPGIPFADTQAVVAATTAADDPLQSCTIGDPSKNVASVWYRLTAPATGRFVVETSRSDYDTVLSAYTGSCGDFHEVGCSDDTPKTVQSRLDLDVTAGTMLLIEVSAYHESMPGTLRIAFHHGCVEGSGACDDGDPCTTGDVCIEGICVGPAGTCDDGNVCTADVCVAGACGHAATAGACEDQDLCTVADACAASACASGPRIDAARLAATLDTALPLACGTERPRVRRTLVGRLGRAGKQINRGALGAQARQVRAFTRARRLLRAVERLAARLRRGGDVPCGDALAVRITTARAQLECVVRDLGAPPS